MTNDKFNNFIREAKALALSEGERGRMRDQLVAYTDMHPMPAPVAPVRSPLWMTLVLSRSASALAIVLVLGITASGMVYASEDALPGDTLYALKVSVTEETVDRLASSKEAKAKWRAERAERRLAEAVQLAAEGKLGADVSAYLAREFDEHADASKALAVSLEAEGKVVEARAITTDLEARLVAHATLLDMASEVERETDGDDSEVRALAASIDEHVAAAPEAVIAIAVEPPPAPEAAAEPAVEDTARTMMLSIEAGASSEVSLKQAEVTAEADEAVVEIAVTAKAEPVVEPADPVVQAQTTQRIAEKVERLLKNRNVTAAFKAKLEAWKASQAQP